jgi:hypothetical protein
VGYEDVWDCEVFELQLMLMLMYGCQKMEKKK